jgi:hypothetical protein
MNRNLAMIPRIVSLRIALIRMRGFFDLIILNQSTLMADITGIHMELFGGETSVARGSIPRRRPEPLIPLIADPDRVLQQVEYPSPPPLVEIVGRESANCRPVLNMEEAMDKNRVSHMESKPPADDQVQIFEHFCKFSFMRSFLSRKVFSS